MVEQGTLFGSLPKRERPTYGSQACEVLAHLEQYGSISPLEAMRKYMIHRLAARVLELRKLGWPIETVNEKHEGGTHARYVLLGRRDS